MPAYIMRKKFAELLKIGDEVTAFEADTPVQAAAQVETHILEDIRWAEDCGESDGDVIGSFTRLSPGRWVVTYKFTDRPDQQDKYYLSKALND